jgi:hypothetical protein
LLRPLPPSLTAFWLKAGVAFLAATLVALLLFRDGEGSQPPVGRLLLAAVVITAVTTFALYLGLRHDLGLPARIALYAVGWNGLVAIVKFGLGPHGMYEVNQTVEFQDVAPNDAFTAVLTTLFVFVLYAAAFTVIYLLVRSRLVRERPRQPKARVRHSRLLLWLLVGVVLIASLGTGLVLVPLIAVSAGSQYVSFVFSSSMSLLVALALAGATALATLALRDTRDRAAVLGDAAVLVTFFWVGLAFLALYHVLWVVYVLALTATWPLRVVVPK